MNRIILIGNGFDLAHGMPTSYNDFLKDYWKSTIEEIKNSAVNKVFENEEIIINRSPSKFLSGTSYLELKEKIKDFDEIIIFKNKFFEKISETSRLQNWVDIENEYYLTLKFTYSERNSKYNNLDIDTLNNDFNRVKILLKNYLLKTEEEFNKTFSNRKLNRYIGSKIFSQFNLNDFTDNSISKKTQEEFNKIELDIKSLNDDMISLDDIDVKKRPLISALNLSKPIDSLKEKLKSGSARNYFELIPEHTLFLNFNYTETELHYEDPNRFENMNEVSSKITKTEFIHIHGNLKYEKYPIIFGFGDELDDDYKEIEKLNNNKYLENIKSIQYLETDNYKKLLSFVNSQDYQIFIFGHSCGVSDRTLLNTIFEHENCVSIKPFYHKRKDSDNYSDIIRNISRNFNDKRIMRDKVVNKMFCEPLS